jgi:trehalose 6-phosphate synthase/phosphatase
VTPTDDKKRDDPFTNEDALRVHIPGGEPVNVSGVRAPVDRSSPTWGGRADQPMSRANSPPPPSLIDKGRLLQQKAKE